MPKAAQINRLLEVPRLLEILDEGKRVVEVDLAELDVLFHSTIDRNRLIRLPLPEVVRVSGKDDVSGQVLD